jgi:uncharacterized SAM-binding protein YcdF (DUF218 family)
LREACYPDVVKSLVRILLSLCLVAVIIVAINYRTIPAANTTQTHFDTIIILGVPANLDGTASPEQRSRVLEGIREYRAGVAPILIMTGGAAHNHLVEAHVMAQFAVSQGVPASAILEEGQAQNTIQNIFYSATILHQHGWHSAEIVSSPSHLPRAALILETFDRVQPPLGIDWRTHAAPFPAEYTPTRRLLYVCAEATYCMRLRLFGFPRSRFLPAP